MQVVKAFEPVITILIARLATAELLAWDSYAVAFIVCVGILLTFSNGDGHFNGSGLALGFLSSCGMPIRNVMVKSVDAPLLITYSMLCELGFVCLAPIYIMSRVLVGSDFSICETMGSMSATVLHGTVAVVSYVGYNVASIVFLSSVSPLTHSIANCMKRLFSTLAAGLFFHMAWPPRLVLGMLIIFGGLIYHVFVGHARKRCRPICSGVMCHFLLSAAGGVMMIMMASACWEADSRAWIAGARFRYYSRHTSNGMATCLVGVKQTLRTKLTKPFQRAFFASASGRAFPVMLLDPATHGNIGDNVINHAERLFLEQFKLVSDVRNNACCFDQCHEFPPCSNEISRFGREGAAIFQGGGNWGDLYRSIQSERIKWLRVLAERVPHIKVVSMPQSLYYQNMSTQMHESSLINAACGKFTQQPTLFWRDEPSFKLALELYPNADNVVVPDIAFIIGPIRHKFATTGAHPVDLLISIRAEESRGGFERNAKIVRQALATTPQITYKITTGWDDAQLDRFTNNSDWSSRMYIGATLLNKGRIVIADKLHVAIVSMLFGIPIIYIDNIYNKSSNVLSNAFSTSADCRRDVLKTAVTHANNFEDALKHAVLLLNGKTIAPGSPQ